MIVNLALTVTSKLLIKNIPKLVSLSLTRFETE